MAVGGVTPAGPMPAPPARRMGVFIDADNLNDATALDHVFATLQERSDRIVYKRAYGRTESLRAIEPVLWRHGVRPVANMVVNKVTTDSALVIDVVEAVCSGVIDAFALCSGDADFVPLATWAREKGCQVLCFSLQYKIFANPESFYDDVVLLEVVDTVAAEDEAAAAIANAARHAALATGPASLAKGTSDEVVEQVLAAFPALRSGQPQHLSQVVAVLRQHGILDKTTKTTHWFSRWPAAFQLTPLPLAHQVRYRQSDASQSTATVAEKPVAPAALLPHLPALQPMTPLVSAQAQAHSPVPMLAPGSDPLAKLALEVERILQALPALRQGPQLLCHVVPVLRQKTILGKATKSTTFFARYATYFQLRPAHQPTHLISLLPSCKGQAAGARQEQAFTQAVCSAATVLAPALKQQTIPEPLSWPGTMGRRPALPLLAKLHGLRSVLVQRALRCVTVANVLLAVPELLQGTPCALGDVASRLRENGLLHTSQSALRILEQHPGAFEFRTDRMPQVVTYRR